MARSSVRSADADPHERAEDRLLRKMASLHKEKVVMAESKAEHRMAGKKGEKAEPRAAKVKGGRDSHKHLEHAAEAKHGGKKPGHTHHHHHHHHHGK